MVYLSGTLSFAVVKHWYGWRASDCTHSHGLFSDNIVLSSEISQGSAYSRSPAWHVSCLEVRLFVVRSNAGRILLKTNGFVVVHLH
jgi:hypothetical protein